MGHVFISYSHQDQAVARRLVDALEGAGIPVWWDEQLRAGEVFDEPLEAALRAASAVIVLWSQASVASRWVRAEATVADRLGTLIPCLIEPCERPIVFELAHTADLSGWTGAADDRAFAGVLASVRARLEKAVGAGAAPPRAVSHGMAPPPANARDPILAVLAFDNQSNDPDLGWFSDGIAEEILAAMSRAPGIKVIGATSSFAFRGQRKADAARALGASHVLDGSVRRGGARVRISATLTEAGSGQVLWAERYDRQLDDALEVQDEIAVLAAEALQSRLRPAAPAAPVDPEAYDLYLRALAERRSVDDAAQERAIALLEAAAARAPGYARAHSALAMALGHRIRKATYFDAAPEAFDAACAAVRASAERALALDPADIEARLALLSLQPVTETWSKQDRLLTEALAANPAELTLLWYRGRWLNGVGRFRDAEQIFGRGYELDPLSPPWMATRGANLFIGGDLAGGERLLQSAWLQRPGDGQVFYLRWATLCITGRFAEAEEVMAAAPPSFGDQSGHRAWASILKDPGDPQLLAEYRSETQRMIDRDIFRKPQNMSGFALLGLIDDAFEFTETLMNATRPDRLWSMWNGNGHGPGTEQLLLPMLSAFHADPRFLSLCHRLGLCAYWAETGRWPDFIVDSPNRAALEARVRELAASG